MDENVKSVIAWCAVGLGNKICTLLGAKYWSELLNYNFKIVWLTDPHCLCPFNSLFEGYEELLLKNTDYLKEKTLIACNKSFPCNETLVRLAQAGATPLVKAHYLKLLLYITKNNKFTSTELFNLQNQIKHYTNIVYQNSILSDEISIEKAVKYLSQFVINKEIMSDVQQYIKANNINEGVYGITLRKTDVPINYDHTSYIKEIQLNPHKRFFITSDDNETKLFFKKFDNVIIFNTESRIEWSSTSVHRNKESVINSFKELLILAHTTPCRNDDDIISTYFFCVLLYNIIFNGMTPDKTQKANAYKNLLLKKYFNERG